MIAIKVSVDDELCGAHGLCFIQDDELFTLDEEGYSNIGQGKYVPPGKESSAEIGVDICPVQALSIETD